MTQSREGVARSDIAPGKRALLEDPAFRRAAVSAAAVSLSYYVTATIGFKFALQPGSVSLLWMPNALVLAGLLLTATRWWWLIVLAAFPAHVASEWQSGVPVVMALSWFLSNTIQALLGAALIRRFVKRDLRFDSTWDLTVFLFFGVFVAPFAASFLDVGLVRLNNWGDGAFWALWRVRFLSNVIATLTLVPWILTWVSDGARVVRNVRWMRYVEAAALLAGLSTVGILVFNVDHDLFRKTPFLYWNFPFLLWATVRFGPMGIANAMLLVMFLAIGGATSRTGPFVTESSEISALSIQLFLIVSSIPLMTLAAVTQERRRAENAARASAERLAFAIDAAQLNTWEWGTADKRLTWSEPGKATLTENGGGSGDAREFAESLIHPEDHAALTAAVSRATARDAPCEVEFRIVRNGSTRWFLSKGKVIHNDSGHPTRMLGIGMDITRRKHVEQAFLETTSRNQAILRAIPDMMFVMDTEGNYLDYYTRDFSLLLVPPETFLGRNVREVLPSDLADRVLACIALLTREQPQVLEYMLPIGGKEQHYEARLVTAQTNHVLCIVRDVTRERRAEEEARDSQEKLRQSNNQIRDLAARLITAQESERRRIALLLHDDVNQNIAVMGLAISRLKHRAASNEQVVAGLDELAQQTIDLTAQIRDLSHDLHPGILEHLGLVTALKAHVADVNQENHFKAGFTARVGPEPIPLNVAVCLYRVALEALHNASRHSGARSAQIELRDENGCLTLEVTDSGRGFDVEKAKQGTGIGLASLEERVRLLQGSLEVRSSSQTGTMLVARVPRSA